MYYKVFERLFEDAIFENWMHPFMNEDNFCLEKLEFSSLKFLLEGSFPIETWLRKISQNWFLIFDTFSFWLNCFVFKQNYFHKRVLMRWKGQN